MAQMVSPQMMILPAAAANPSAKDSRWLTLEVCREFQRSKCSRTDTECKFAHPPPHVEVQNGRVVACFDSIKGKCQRKDPPCKYLHPPQHLREQLLQNGRNNLILKNMQLQAYQHHMAAGVLPVTGAKTMAAMTTVLPGGQYSYLNPYALPVAAPNPASPYNPYITTSVPPSHSVAMTTNGDANSPIISQAIPHMIPAAPKAVRADKFEAQTVQENGEGLTSTHTHLVDPLTFPTTYFTQPQPSAAAAAAAAAAAVGPGTLPMVLTKKRPRDPADDIFLQSSVPGIVPAYKRIAVGDASVGKGGIPLYPSHLMSPYHQQQAASLVPLQQHPSYIPMPYHLPYTQPLAGHPPSMPRF